MSRWLFITIILLHPVCNPFNITQEQAAEIGKKIWHNECACSINGLTSWNDGEDFASLGIGHFIWHKANHKHLFVQTFPSLLQFMKKRGENIPEWLEKARLTGCPWQSRQHFLQEFNSKRMKELRTFLANTINHQIAFMIQRTRKLLPHLVQSVEVAKKNHIKTQFNRMVQCPRGLYPLIDYVNFKGEGIKTAESYQAARWGLLQVLEQMQGNSKDKKALLEFGQAAQKVLENRVAHAPRDRNEQRWLPGWINRIKTYYDF